MVEGDNSPEVSGQEAKEPLVTEPPEEESIQEPEAKHKVYLTFDDGPSKQTEAVLDILDEYGVKATFFVVGKEDEAAKQMLAKIAEAGHSIGMHSYSHKYTEIYESLDSFKADLEKIRSLVKEKAGVECSLYRFPGGSSNSIGKKHIQEFIGYLDEEKYKKTRINRKANDKIIIKKL